MNKYDYNYTMMGNTIIVYVIISFAIAIFLSSAYINKYRAWWAFYYLYTIFSNAMLLCIALILKTIH